MFSQLFKRGHWAETTSLLGFREVFEASGLVGG
jgi:hypothetical protein